MYSSIWQMEHVFINIQQYGYVHPIRLFYVVSEACLLILVILGISVDLAAIVSPCSVLVRTCNTGREDGLDAVIYGYS